MKKVKMLSFILAFVILCTMSSINVFAELTSTISVVLLGNNGTATVAGDYSESTGLVWQTELVDGNKIGTDTIKHINSGPFDETNLKAGYKVIANEGYYINAFYRCREDYDNKTSSLDNLDLENEEFYKYDENGYLTEGIITELTWPDETFYISFEKIPDETSTLSLIVFGNNGTVTNLAGDYTTSIGIKWDSELTDGNKTGTDTLKLEHQTPWGETADGMKAGYLVTAKEGYYIKALYPDEVAYDMNYPFDSENLNDVKKNTDGYITSCQWVWYATPEAVAYFVFEKIPGVETTSVKVSDLSTGVKFEATVSEVPEDTQLSVSIIKSGEKYNSINTILGDNVNGIVAYDISLLSNNTKVQPNGFVEVYLPVPENFDSSRLTVYYVNIENNTKESYKVNVKTIDGVKYAVFETNHFSTYVLAENVLTETVKSDNPKTGDDFNLIYFVITLFSGCVLSSFMIKRKKRVD